MYYLERIYSYVFHSDMQNKTLLGSASDSALPIFASRNMRYSQIWVKVTRIYIWTQVFGYSYKYRF